MMGQMVKKIICTAVMTQYHSVTRRTDGHTYRQRCQINIAP